MGMVLHFRRVMWEFLKRPLSGKEAQPALLNLYLPIELVSTDENWTRLWEVEGRMGILGTLHWPLYNTQTYDPRKAVFGCP